MNTTGRQIIVQESAGVTRRGEVVTAAVPCPAGNRYLEKPLCMLGPEGEPQPCQIRVLKQWPDGAAKWLLADFPASVAAREHVQYLLCHGDAPPVSHPVQVRQGTDSWEVATGVCTFIIGARFFGPFQMVEVAGKDVLRRPGSVCLLGVEDTTRCAAIDAITLEEQGPLRSVVRVRGSFDGTSIRFSSRLHFFSESSAVRIEFTLHNPAAARHTGGLWDLGDEGSFFFKSLGFSFCSNVADGETFCIPEPGEEPLIHRGAAFSLYQESSGGENWRSAVHRNCNGEVPMTRCGYFAGVGGREVASGRRATPLLWYGNGDSGMAVAFPQFWENFPAEISGGNGKLEISPFPQCRNGLHELQGGEQKTHEFVIDFSTGRDGLVSALNPLAAYASPETYVESGIFHDLPGAGDLVDSFTSAEELLAKREQADEYGWRNFGEIYADHEAVYHDGAETFVSHYNNQYDFIAGLYGKSFATGSLRWRTLAHDLARHVRDIDIYHTDLDREEYNHGLFWHTDHYVDAGTSSHRSFSKEHLKVKAPQLCGGGPGAEHCYTTGLMLHYVQTGNPDFKEAVIALAKWELLALAGAQTLLAAFKRGVENLNHWRTHKGSGRLFPRFPLTRGTGNAITACLDAFEIGGGREFLDQAEELIRHTLHPEDEIGGRHLLDAEVGWSYTVLLGAVVKFLDKKSELGERDAGFAYARASLLAYAEWMALHEYPYLDKPEILEYPNETWAAQDLRKSVVFYHAARYTASSNQHAAFTEKARYFYEYASSELKRHRSSSFSRPVVLMLQNGWVGSRLGAFAWCQTQAARGTAPVGGRPAEPVSLGAVAARTLSEMASILQQTSVAREAAWLRARLGK